MVFEISLNGLGWKKKKTTTISEYVRKPARPGVAFCIYCQQCLDYGGRGKSFIKRHSESASHKRKRNSVKTTKSLPAVFQATASLERGETPYMKHKVMATGRQHIMSIMRRFGLKNIPLHGKERKQRVCTNMFDKTA